MEQSKIIDTLETYQSTAAPGLYRFGSTNRNILPSEWVGLLWVHKWTWYGLLERLGHGGGHIHRPAALNPWCDGEVGGGVLGLVSFSVPPSRGAVRLFGACICQTCWLYNLDIELR